MKKKYKERNLLRSWLFFFLSAYSEVHFWFSVTSATYSGMFCAALQDLRALWIHVHFNPALHTALKKPSLRIRNFSEQPMTHSVRVASAYLILWSSNRELTAFSARITSALEHLQHTVVLTWNCRIWKAAFSVTLISAASASPSVVSGRQRGAEKS